MSDTASVRSSCSSKYRTVSSGSSVDESLFGGSSINRKFQSNRSRVKIKPDTAYISKSHLEKIRNRSYISLGSTREMHSSHSKLTSGRLTDPEKIEKAVRRKKHMLEMDQKAQNELQKSVSDQLSEDRIKDIRKKAQEQVDDTEDIVKLLKMYSERAAAFTIRDQQLKDKIDMEKKESVHDRRMDLAMEIDRLKELESREQDEKRKLDKRLKDRKVIEDQIEFRRQQQLLREESREQENMQMLQTIKQNEEKAAAQQVERSKEAAIARLEVMKANEDALAAKAAREYLDKEEEERIIAYQMKRDEILRQREAEAIIAERKKKEMQKRMLEAQTRELDKQAQIDELRARRAMEAKERKYRENKLLEARKKQQSIVEINDSRKRQEEVKRELAKRDAELRRQEHECTLKLAHDMSKREQNEAAARADKNVQFREALQKQIEDNVKKGIMAKKMMLKKEGILKKECSDRSILKYSCKQKFI